MVDFLKNIKNKIFNLKGLTTIGIADIFGMGISAGFWLILASIMSVEEYGEIIYLIALVSIAQASSVVGSPNTIMVFSSKQSKIIPTLMFLSLIFALVSSLIIFLITQKIELLFLVFSFLIFEISIHVLLGKKFYKKYSQFIFIQRILQFILGISFYFVFELNGVLFGIILSNLPLLIIFYKEIKISKLDFSLLKLKKDFIISNYSIRLVQIFRKEIDKIIIVPLLGFTILGNFALSIQFYTILMVFSSISFKFLVPEEATGAKNKNLKKALILSSIIISFTSFFISPFIIENLFTKFYESIIPIQIISFSVIPSTIGMVLYSKILALEKSKLLLLASIIQLLSVLLGTILLGFFFGIIGISFSFLIASIVYATTLAMINYRLIGMKKFDI